MHTDEMIKTAIDALTVKRIFGKPYERDGLTIIPAASVTGGYGAGAGKDKRGQNGEGGGFGLRGRPVGAYVIKDGRVTWIPAIDPPRMLAVAGAVAIVYVLTHRPRARA